MAIVFLVVDVPAFMVLRMLDVRALFFGDCAVCFHFTFHFFDALLVPVQPGGFTFVQLARLHAMVDALLLDFLTLVDAGRGRGILDQRIDSAGTAAAMMVLMCMLKLPEKVVGQFPPAD